jgi:hypothetical protein
MSIPNMPGAAAGSDHIRTTMDRAPGRSIGPMGCVEPLVLPLPSWTLPVGPSGGMGIDVRAAVGVSSLSERCD